VRASIRSCKRIATDVFADLMVFTVQDRIHQMRQQWGGVHEEFELLQSRFLSHPPECPLSFRVSFKVTPIRVLSSLSPKSLECEDCDLSLSLSLSLCLSLSLRPFIAPNFVESSVMRKCSSQQTHICLVSESRDTTGTQKRCLRFPRATRSLLVTKPPLDNHIKMWWTLKKKKETRRKLDCTKDAKNRFR
jgi:hypothetical protein